MFNVAIELSNEMPKRAKKTETPVKSMGSAPCQKIAPKQNSTKTKKCYTGMSTKGLEIKD